MIFIYIVCIIIYCFFLIKVIYHWKKISPDSNVPKVGKEAITVLIPARNEANHILSLLTFILEQIEKGDQVIVIDDHSSDDTSTMVKSFIQNHRTEDVKLIQLYENEGKKVAISTGVKAARNNLIACVDADCIPGSEWLASVRKRLTTGHTKLLSGPVMCYEGNILEEFQRYELAALVGIGGVAIQYNKPMMMNGANMAFKRDVFIEVDGYTGNESIATGDDEFLMRKIYSRYPDGVQFYKTEKYCVKTKAFTNLSSLIHQKKRWASKWNKGGNGKIALFILIFYLILLYGCYQFLLGNLGWKTYLAGFLLKGWIDGYLVHSVLRTYSMRIRIIPFVISEILYPFYAILIAILANFGSYSWKGRKYKI